MPVVSILRPTPVAIEIPDEDGGADLVRLCGRCRLSFVRHPSTDLDTSATWWLCPSCRIRLLGDASGSTSPSTS